MAEIASLSSWEIGVWGDYYARHGFAADRIEWAIAKAGAADLQSRGSRLTAADLIPRFQPADPSVRRARLRAFLDGIPERVSNGG